MKFRLLLILILAALLVNAVAQDQRGSSQYRARNVHAGNLIRVTFYNHGMLGSIKGDQSLIYGGEWPINSGMVQMGNASSYVMSQLRTFAGIDSTGDSTYTDITPCVFCQGWDPNIFSHDSLGVFLGFEPLPGYYSLANKEKDPYHAVAMSHQAFTWPATWPDKMDDPLNPGWGGHWNGYFGKDQKNADEESYYALDDYQFKKKLRAWFFRNRSHRSRSAAESACVSSCAACSGPILMRKIVFSGFTISKTSASSTTPKRSSDSTSAPRSAPSSARTPIMMMIAPPFIAKSI